MAFNIMDMIASLTSGQDPNKAVLDANGALPPGGGQQAAAPMPPIPTTPQGVKTPVTNPQPAGSSPTVTQSPPDLANMYAALMAKNQNAQQLDSGLTMIAAGLSNNLATRQALIQSASGGGGGKGMSLSASDLINFQKQEQAQRDLLIQKQALPALMKQYNLTPAQAEYLQSSGQLPEVLKHYSTENLGVTENAETGQKTLFNQRTGKQVATIGGEKPDPTQVVKTPQGEQVINMRTAQKVGEAFGPTDANVDAKGTKFPALDTGYDYTRDEKGLVKLNDQGVPTVYALPDSKAQQAEVEAQQKKVAQHMQGVAAVSSVQAASSAVQKAIDEATVPGAVGPGSKLYMQTVGQLGGMAGNVIRDNLDTIKANATFDKLAAMRQASPTGAALGSVSDFENKLLGAATATLSPNLRADQLMDNVYRVQATMELIAKGKRQGDKHVAYTDEATFNADLKKRIAELQAERIKQKTGGQITVTRE